MSETTKRWRVIVEPFTGDDPRGRIRRHLFPRKWRWVRERSIAGGWWVDDEGYAETIHAAARKAMGGWKLWALETHRLEAEYAAAVTYKYEPPAAGSVEMELLK